MIEHFLFRLSSRAVRDLIERVCANTSADGHKLILSADSEAHQTLRPEHYSLESDALFRRVFVVNTIYKLVFVSLFSRSLSSRDYNFPSAASASRCISFRCFQFDRFTWIAVNLLFRSSPPRSLVTRTPEILHAIATTEWPAKAIAFYRF